MNKDQFAYLNMEIKALEAERDRLKSELMRVSGKTGFCVLCEGYTKEIDRLKAELKKHHGNCKEDYDEAVKDRWDACLNRDAWKSKCENAERIIVDKLNPMISQEKSKAEKLAEAIKYTLEYARDGSHITLRAALDEYGEGK